MARTYQQLFASQTPLKSKIWWTKCSERPINQTYLPERTQSGLTLEYNRFLSTWIVSSGPWHQTRRFVLFLNPKKQYKYKGYLDSCWVFFTITRQSGLLRKWGLSGVILGKAGQFHPERSSSEHFSTCRTYEFPQAVFWFPAHLQTQLPHDGRDRKCQEYC